MPKPSKLDVVERIEQKLKLGLYLRSLKYQPGRQTWGGAGVIIRYPTDVATEFEAKDEHDDRNLSWALKDEIFETPYAGAVAKLYNDIREFATVSSHYNHLSKFELWSETTKAGKTLSESRGDISGETLLRHIWETARELISKWERN